MSVVLLCLLPHVSPAISGRNAVKPYQERINRLRDGIKSIEYDEETYWKDERTGNPPLESHRTVHVSFRRDLGKLRRDLINRDDGRGELTAPSGQGERKKRATEFSPQKYPSPSWLFELPGLLENSEVKMSRKGGVAVVEVRPRRGMPKGNPPRIDVSFNDGYLPVCVETYGSSGQLLDEIHIRWLAGSKGGFPSEIVFIYHSINNTLTRIVRFQSVKINAAVSATLFDNP